MDSSQQCVISKVNILFETVGDRRGEIDIDLWRLATDTEGSSGVETQQCKRVDGRVTKPTYCVLRISNCRFLEILVGLYRESELQGNYKL
jgi:hypothetical protein